MSYTSAYRPDRGNRFGAGAQQTATPEVVIARFRPYGGRLVFSAAVFVVVSWATTFYQGSFAEQWQNVLLLIGAGLAVLLLCVLPYLSWLAHRCTLTNRRVIQREGLFVRIRREMLVRDIRDVTLRRGLLQRAVGSGTISLHGTEEGAMSLRGVPSASLVRATLMELMEHSDI